MPPANSVPKRRLKGLLLANQVSTVQDIEDSLSLPHLAEHIICYLRQGLKKSVPQAVSAEAGKRYLAKLFG